MTTNKSLRGDRALAAIAWAAIAFIYVYMFLVGGTYPFLGSALVRALNQVLLWMIVIGWLIAWARRSVWGPTREALLVVGPGIAAGAASALGAASRRMSLEAVYWAALLSLSFLVMTRIAANEYFRLRMRGLVVALFLIVLVGYFVQLVASWADWYRTVGRVTGIPLHPGGASLSFGATPVVAIVLLTLGPPAAAVLLAMPRGRLIVAGMAVLAAFEVVATGSRSGYLGLGLEGVLVLGLAGRSATLVAVRSAPRWAIVLVGVVGLAVGIVLFGALGPRLFDSSTLKERWSIWQSAFTMWRASPWLGSGAGLWPYLRASAYPIGAPSLVVPHAHNPAIQLLAETGISGIAAVAFGVAILIRALVRRAAWGTGVARSLAIGSLISLAGFATASILDDFVNLPSAMLALVLPIACALGEADPGAGPARTLPRRATLIAAVISLVMISGGWKMSVAALINDRGVREANIGNWVAAQAHFAQAIALDPNMPLYRIESATALATLADPAAAWREMQVVGEADGTPTVLVSRALIAFENGDRLTAIMQVRRAYQRAALDAAALVNIGSLSQKLGDTALATNAYADALVAAPALAANEEMRASPMFGAILARAVERAPGNSPDPYAEEQIRAYGGSAAEVVSELTTLPAGAPRDRALATALALDGRAEEARSLLLARLTVDPVDGLTADLLARLFVAIGDTSSAARYGHWAGLVGVGSAAIGLTSGSRIETVGEAGISNLASNYPWAIYGRFGPNVLLPPNALAIPDQ
ncbi:MAG: O-antigen ligase family protein [Chloroflexi bacterium]|nr:O-antigen ligase family protein [Chloroflexota bacterium]